MYSKKQCKAQTDSLNYHINKRKQQTSETEKVEKEKHTHTHTHTQSTVQQCNSCSQPILCLATNPSSQDVFEL